MVSHSEKEQSVTLAGLPSDKPYRRVFWSAADSERIQDGGEVSCDKAGNLGMTLPPLSIVAVTKGTAGWKNLGIEKR